MYLSSGQCSANNMAIVSFAVATPELQCAWSVGTWSMGDIRKWACTFGPRLEVYGYAPTDAELPTSLADVNYLLQVALEGGDVTLQGALQLPRAQAAARRLAPAGCMLASSHALGLLPSTR